MRIIADLHIHSKFSRATSKDMDVRTIALWAKKKGIDIVGTGDFTHPLYFSLLKSELRSAQNGLFSLKDTNRPPYFMLTAEISHIYSEGGKMRRIHNIILAPSFEAALKINSALSKRGNLSSAGLPILGIPAKEIVKIAMDASPDCMVIPAHAWTPWFSVFGSNSGFDSIEECFGEYSRYIHAIETGLSSDPAMNWRLSGLDRITLISNSDAHSPSKLGREANVFDAEMDYNEIVRIIKEKDKKRFLFTIESYPEEGKYHYDGHRACNIMLSPEDTKKHRGRCPVCGKPVTVGVMSRVEELSDRKAGFIPEDAIPARHLVPLEEIIAEALAVGVNTSTVQKEYDRMIAMAGSEFFILLDMPEEEIKRITEPRVSEGIMRVRNKQLSITPGYDGIHGVISIFGKKRQKIDIKEEADMPEKGQMGLF